MLYTSPRTEEEIIKELRPTEALSRKVAAVSVQASPDHGDSIRRHQWYLGRSKRALKELEQVVTVDALVSRYRAQKWRSMFRAGDFCERAHDTVMRMLFSLQNHMAAFLVDDVIAPASAEHLDESRGIFTLG